MARHLASTLGYVALACSVAIGADSQPPNVLQPSVPDADVYHGKLCPGAEGDALDYPPVFGQAGDGWPSKVKGTGIIRGLVPGVCGIACQASQVRIEILDAPRSFRAKDIYAFAYCVEGSDLDDYCNRRVSFRAEKLMRNKDWCGLADSFDSKGAPFYAIINFHRDVVLLPQEPVH